MVAQTTTTEPRVVNGINVDDVSPDRRRQAGRCKGHDKLARRHNLARPGAEPSASRRFRDRRRTECRDSSRSTSTNPANSVARTRFANPQEYLIAALNACMIVGYAAQCAVRGITIESLDRDRRRDRSARLPRDRSRGAVGLREAELRCPHQGERNQRGVRQRSRSGHGDLAEFLQHVPVPWLLKPSLVVE